MYVCCDCCVLSGRGLCDELITRPDESYRLWCVVVCDLETSRMRKPWPTGGCCAKIKVCQNPYHMYQERQSTFNVTLRRAYVTIGVTCYKYASVALGIQHAKRMRRIIICGLSGCTVFFHVMKCESFEGKN